jgi:hypothetical protein
MQDAAPQEIVLQKGVFLNAMQKVLNRISGFDNVCQIEIFTPHRSPAR